MKLSNRTPQIRQGGKLVGEDVGSGEQTFLNAHAERRRRDRLLLAGMAPIITTWMLWVLGVWYAKYVECDDLLRDVGGVELRTRPGEMFACSRPDPTWPLPIFETYWLIGTAVALLAAMAWTRKRGRPAKGGIGGP